MFEGSCAVDLTGLMYNEHAMGYREADYKDPCAFCDTLARDRCKRCGRFVCEEHRPENCRRCQSCESWFEENAPKEKKRLGHGITVTLVVLGFLAITVSVGLKESTQLGNDVVAAVGIGGLVIIALAAPVGILTNVFASRGHRRHRQQFLGERFL